MPPLALMGGQSWLCTQSPVISRAHICCCCDESRFAGALELQGTSMGPLCPYNARSIPPWCLDHSDPHLLPPFTLNLF